MLKKINIAKLRVGMYANLPLAWHKHSFIKNKFTIISEAQIGKIKDMGLQEITIDTDRGNDISADPAPIAALSAISKEPEIQTVPAGASKSSHHP
jgi:hypothetical protein